MLETWVPQRVGYDWAQNSAVSREASVVQPELCSVGTDSYLPSWVTLSLDDRDVSYGALSWKMQIPTTLSAQLAAFPRPSEVN